jgi:peptidoglycan hydrolase CwlO-like protein
MIYHQQLKKKIDEYDSHYKVSETASSYLQSGIDQANKSVHEVCTQIDNVGKGSCLVSCI